MQKKEEAEKEGGKKWRGQQALAHQPTPAPNLLPLFYIIPPGKWLHNLFMCCLPTALQEYPVASRHPHRHFETTESIPRSGLPVNHPFSLQHHLDSPLWPASLPRPPPLSTTASPRSPTVLALLKCCFHNGISQTGLHEKGSFPNLSGFQYDLIFTGDTPPPPDICLPIVYNMHTCSAAGCHVTHSRI